MSVREVTYYQVQCDGCGQNAQENSEFSAWSGPDEARINAEDDAWVTDVGDLDFCGRCQARPGDVTEGQDDCEHGPALTDDGDQTFTCPACGLTFGQVHFRQRQARAAERLATLRAAIGVTG
jgi:hypothetical protein